MNNRQVIDSYGGLAVVTLEDAHMWIDGWVASFDAGPVEGFRVYGGGSVFTEYEAALHLHSPSAQAAYPSLVAVDQCRFQLRVPLSAEEQARMRASVIWVTPLFNGQDGRTMLHILEPALPLPPQKDVQDIGGGFIEVAAEFLGHFIQRGGLLPDEQVLDVGSGVGRMAFALAHYLNPAAEYQGFDIVDRLVTWCQETITPQYPNFQFRKVDVYNKWYNPGGTLKPDQFPFPYANDHFDFVFLVSVFTHMRGPELRHYLDEIYRVLKPGGRCLCTFFILNDEAERLIKAGNSTQNLLHKLPEDCYTANPDMPEHVIGFKEPVVRRWISERGFSVSAYYPGYWCGRERFLTYQDMLILHKPPAG